MGSGTARKVGGEGCDCCIGQGRAKLAMDGGDSKVRGAGGLIKGINPEGDGGSRGFLDGSSGLVGWFGFFMFWYSRLDKGNGLRSEPKE